MTLSWAQEEVERPDARELTSFETKGVVLAVSGQGEVGSAMHGLTSLALL